MTDAEPKEHRYRRYTDTRELVRCDFCRWIAPLAMYGSDELCDFCGSTDLYHALSRAKVYIPEVKDLRPDPEQYRIIAQVANLIVDKLNLRRAFIPPP
jgi:hypothetical protein